MNINSWKDKDLIKAVTGIRRCEELILFELDVDYYKKEDYDKLCG